MIGWFIVECKIGVPFVLLSLKVGESNVDQKDDIFGRQKQVVVDHLDLIKCRRIKKVIE
jgi:hypothetical protein